MTLYFLRVFLDPALVLFEQLQTFGHGLLTNNGDSWLHQRRLIQPIFHRERLAAFGRLMTESALVYPWSLLNIHSKCGMFIAGRFHWLYETTDNSYHLQRAEKDGYVWVQSSLAKYGARKLPE